MSDLKQCDICKTIIRGKDRLFHTYITEYELPEAYYKRAPRYKIDICLECLTKGFTFVYKDLKKFKET